MILLWSSIQSEKQMHLHSHREDLMNEGCLSDRKPIAYQQNHLSRPVAIVP